MQAMIPVVHHRWLIARPPFAPVFRRPALSYPIRIHSIVQICWVIRIARSSHHVVSPGVIKLRITSASAQAIHSKSNGIIRSLANYPSIPRIAFSMVSGDVHSGNVVTTNIALIAQWYEPLECRKQSLQRSKRREEKYRWIFNVRCLVVHSTTVCVSRWVLLLVYLASQWLFYSPRSAGYVVDE